MAIVGNSGAGKTTLLERLIPALKGKGLRVGGIKHDAHRFDIDHPGKDSH
ncbi:MAG: molybdopterin-guanine dinucleotide biosynthesis protein B, partial [Candidatus Deferrimicrobiaceae bacterium]